MFGLSIEVVLQRTHSLDIVGLVRLQYKSMLSYRAGMRLVLLYLGVLLSRVVLIFFPPTGNFYNIDELEMTLSCLDRFLGVPPTSLQWPGSILQMLSVPIFSLDFLLRGGLSGGLATAPAHFAAYISQAYADPRHSVTLLRLLVAIIASTAPVFAFLIARTLNNTEYVAWICSAIAAFTPVVVRQSAMAMGEGVAFAFALATVLLVLRSGWRRAFQAGFLFSAALAARITMAGLIVLPILLIAFDTSIAARRRMAGLCKLIVGVSCGFLFWCPFLWIEPVRFAKAVFGHLSPHSGLNVTAFLTTWVEGMGFALSLSAIMSIGGAITLFRHSRYRAVSAAALLTIVFVSLPLLSSGNDVFPRYFLPLLPSLFILTAVTLSSDFEKGWLHSALLTIFTCGCAAMLAETAVGEMRLRQADDLTRGVEAARSVKGESSLFLPQEALYLFRVPLTDAVYQRMKDRAGAQLQDHSGLLRFLKLRGIPQSAAMVFLSDFTEDEQALNARLNAASAASQKSNVSIYFYYDPESIHGIVAERLTPADYTLAEAKEQFHLPAHSAILLQKPDSSLGTPVWRGAREWFLYCD